MASTRLNIQNQLVTILGTITTGNGYNNTVAKVTKKLKKLDSIPKYPELSVLAGVQKKIPADESGTLYKVTATFAVVGYVRTTEDVTDSGLLNDACDKLIEDINEALLSETSLYTVGVKQLVIEEDEPLLDYESNFGLVFVIISVIYYHDNNI